MATIPPHQGLLRPRPGAQGQHTVHQHQLWRRRQLVQRPQHGPLGGGADAEAIDLRRRGLAQTPAQGPAVNHGHQGGPPPGGELLAIGEACPLQGLRGRRRQHHGGGQHGSKQAAPAHFIDAGHRGGIVAGESGGDGPRAQRFRRHAR